MDNSTDSNTSDLNSTPDFRRSFIFILLCTFFIPSTLCYLYLFINFVHKHQLRRNVHNHTVLLILIFSFLQVISEQPLTLSYLHNGISLVKSDGFCKFWSAQDFVLGGIILMLMSYSSSERYLVIFHRPFILRHFIILHYLPIIICIMYPFVFYIGMIYIYPCINYFDYTINLCGGPCYVFDVIPSTFDLLFNITVFETVALLGNIVLVSRVLHKKHRMKQQNKWKKNRRLLIQVLSITLQHNIMLALLVIFMLIQLFSTTSQPMLVDLTYNVLQYGIYLVHLLCPFVSLVGLPEVWPRSVSDFLRRLLNKNAVQPIIPIPLNTHTRALQQLRTN